MVGLIINGVQVKLPKSFTVDHQDIDSDTSGRNAKGEMVRDVLTKKVKLNCEWGPMADSEISSILQNVDKAFFTITYPDPKIGTQLTKTFYAGDKTSPAYSFNEKFKKMKWSGLTINFIEK
ncbi:DUF6711 family protein [Vagococcus intermedius]|uniref:Uncharacterized protein n=1 Tax=Vagococcus intermedius TaxID=2991418 RepID=A0AAF0CWW1_9ENTE|nr:DUF6711 family protein [Vagococcus intermedius]WEG74363.1 hypothetical protein OL234_10685 [Vagococcus intermedius]WEG76486.1 hypothetical protein OL235_10855 [Vagococcus intermedius]